MKDPALKESMVAGDGGNYAPASSVPFLSLQVPSVERLLQLEDRVAEKQEQLARAVAFLHEAAFLARYHQPSLERSIRAFLNGMEAR